MFPVELGDNLLCSRKFFFCIIFPGRKLFEQSSLVFNSKLTSFCIITLSDNFLLDITYVLLAGEGLGSDKSGRAYPVMAGNVKLDNLGVGAHQPGEVTPDDDIYEQYKKRMMLGYRHRPNPLVKPCLLCYFILYYHV